MNWKTSENKKLVEAFLTLKSPAEAQAFLRDLMTEKEIDEFAKRLKAAQMLSDNTSYLEIESATGLSSATVARVSKWLNGKEQGYKTVLTKMHHRSPSVKRKGLS